MRENEKKLVIKSNFRNNIYENNLIILLNLKF